ncbi:hypothetical protein BKI52_12030 [marine bacterium AO1-C]|nr:hypothetical protein BKI52_12030 [marine bacterium AO1-C]
MTLKEELNALRTRAAKGLAAQGHDAYIDGISQSGRLAEVPSTGDIAPSFVLPDDKGNFVSSEVLLQRGPLIVSFYRGDWCVFCNLELRALQRSLAEFLRYGASLVGISPQTVAYSHMNADRRNVQYQILSDSGNKIANEYGLMFSMPQQMVNAFNTFGIDIAKVNGGQNQVEVPVPATFVINTDGRVAYRFLDADYTKRAEPSEIIACLMDIRSKVA